MNQNKELQHIPVLLDELIDALNIDNSRPSIIVDCTIGLAGHARAILEKSHPQTTFIGIDLDPKSIEIAKENLKSLPQNINLINANFGNIAKVLKHLNIKEVDIIYADLGISSYQLDASERGFSFQKDGPLDMRMSPNLPKTATDLINTLKESKLVEIIKTYGEEKSAKPIAKLICQVRKKERIERTKQLANLVCKAYGIDPEKISAQRIHPATKTFQALRIAVNHELDNLSALLKSAPHILKSGGRFAVISFHSLEDRIVKNNFKENEAKGIYKILTPKPVKPTPSEILRNPRARSAKLRVAEKI